VSNAIVGYLETSQRVPKVATVARLASALNLTAPYLAYGLGEQTSDDLPATTDGMGSRLASMRVERGLTKAELARLVKLSASSFAKIEAGGQTGLDVIEDLATVLGVSPGWLAFGVGPQVLPSRRRSRQVAQPAEPEP
jgi:transcriptional regulator with XRE-family HTH domain